MSTPGQSAVLECPEQVSRQDAVEAPPTGIAPLEHDPTTPRPELSTSAASLTERSSDEAGLQSEDGVLTPAGPTCNESLSSQPDASVTEPQSEGLASSSLAPPPETDSTQLADCSALASSVAVASDNEAGTQAETDSTVGSDSSASPLASSSPPPLPYNTSSEIDPGLDAGLGSSVRPEESQSVNDAPTDSVVVHETLTPDDADATTCVLASTVVVSAVPPDVQLEDDEMEADSDRDVHIMQSALFVDVEPSSDTLYEPDTPGVDTSTLGRDAEESDSGSYEDEDDEDAEWTSVEHADGQTLTPRATTPVRSLSPSTREEDGEGEPVPTTTSDLAATAVLLTESEYCQLGDFQAADAEAEAEAEDTEDTDLPSAHHPPASTAAAPSRVKHTPAPLVLTNSADRPHTPPSPSPAGSSSPSSSATATTTPARVRVHTPDKPDWAVAPGAQTADDLKKKARRHSYEHPDWAVAPEPECESPVGAGAAVAGTGRRKSRHSDPGGLGLASASASLDGSLGGGPGGRELGRGRGKRRTHRGRHSR